MTTSLRLPPRHTRTATAAATTIALVLVVLLSPDAGRAAAAPNVFATLRVPGETGLVASHRGDQDGAPENTLAAMSLAIDSAVDFVETDLQLTSDGVPVLMHDWTVDRTTDGTGPVWNMTWKQLSRLDAGSWYSDAFAGTRVPRLDEFLELVAPSDKRIILELKGSWTEEQLAPVAEQIQARRLASRVIVASFDIVTLANLAAVSETIARVVIARQVVGDPAVLAATCGAIAIVTSRSFVQRDPEAVTRIHDAGLGVMLYTLNDEQTWTEAVSLGVDGIITDRPTQLDRWIATAESGVTLAPSRVDPAS
jgi:glycerophosphoryl diester phosphodiesterase